LSVEKQIDEMASMDNSSGDSNSDAILKDNLGRRSKSNMLRRAIQKVRNSKTVKFILFKEAFPKHRVIENISPLHAVLVFYVCLFIALLGFMVLAYATFLGFLAYYVIVAIATIEALHCLCDR